MTRSIVIIPVLNGYMIECGCQKVVFTDKQSMLTQLSEYYDKPDEVERRFVERAVNKMQDNPCPPPTNIIGTQREERVWDSPIRR